MHRYNSKFAYICRVIQRQAKDKILEMAKKFPVIALVGPRQSGKTTLSKMIFKKYRYVSLEDPDNALFAEKDPKGFLKLYDQYVIFDEIQKVPSLFSYIQGVVDASGKTGIYVLSGSQNFQLLEKITQTLAGRVYMMELLPLSQQELKVVGKKDCFNSLVAGGYPRIYDKEISPTDYYPNYIKTYIERDVRSIVNVQDLSLFRKYVQLLAYRVGQLLNLSSISKELGVDVKTLQKWLSVLETSYIVFTLNPWHQNFSKRLVKTPKLYFYDTGLVSYLLGIEKGSELITSKFKGALFENYGILEILKAYKNKGLQYPFYFWRDSNGNEIDLLIEKGLEIKLIEIKASETVKSEYLKSLHYLDSINQQFEFKHFLYNTMDEVQARSNETIVGWRHAVKVLEGTL